MQSHCQAKEEEGPWPGKPRPQNHLLPSAPSCLPLWDAERREQMEGREAGPVAVRRGLSDSKGCPLPLPEAGRLPRALAGLASEGRGTGHRGRPQPRVGGVSSRSRAWSLGQAWGRGKGNALARTGPHRCPLPPRPRPDTGPQGLSGQEGERVLCGCGREGKERADKQKADLGPSPLVQLTQQSRVTGGWRHVLTATSTDRQTCTPRPPRGPGQPVQRGLEPAAAHLPCVAPHPPGG